MTRDIIPHLPISPAEIASNAQLMSKAKSIIETLGDPASPGHARAIL